MHSTRITPGTLYVVATPLGNTDDLSPRAREVLGGVDMVLAEDTRRSGKLFQNCGIASPGFVSFHDHNEGKRLKRVLTALEEGKAIAMISDAGTPLLSDPGYQLVRACREQGWDVVPVPGPSAPLTALMACGLPPQPFTFIGFLPRKDGDKRRLFEDHGPTGATLIFFERKSRLMCSLELAGEILGNREVCVTRELTKVHEEFILGNLNDLDSLDVDLRGEFTVVIGPAGKEQACDAEHMKQVLAQEKAHGGKPREVARRAAARVHGWSTKAAYELLGQLHNDTK